MERLSGILVTLWILSVSGYYCDRPFLSNVSPSHSPTPIELFPLCNVTLEINSASSVTTCRLPFNATSINLTLCGAGGGGGGCSYKYEPDECGGGGAGACFLNWTIKILSSESSPLYLIYQVGKGGEGGNGTAGGYPIPTAGRTGQNSFLVFSSDPPEASFTFTAYAGGGGLEYNEGGGGGGSDGPGYYSEGGQGTGDNDQNLSVQGGDQNSNGNYSMMSEGIFISGAGGGKAKDPGGDILYPDGTIKQLGGSGAQCYGLSDDGVGGGGASGLSDGQSTHCPPPIPPVFYGAGGGASTSKGGKGGDGYLSYILSQ